MTVDRGDIGTIQVRWPRAERHDSWATTTFRIDADTPGEPSVRALAELARRGIVVRAIVSDADESLPISEEAPTGDQLELVQAYLDDAGKAKARSASSAVALVLMVEDRVKAWVLECHRGAWTPDVEALRHAVAGGWLRVADAICSQQSLGFGSEHFGMRTSPGPNGGRSVLLGFSEGAAPPPGIRVLISDVADAHAWLAISETFWPQGAPNSGEVHLLVDDPVSRRLEPGVSPGGVHLYEWLNATSDANRAEAVRAEFRKYIEFNRDGSLPDGRRIATAAERMRIALVSGNIAAIEAAISSSTLQARTVVEEIGRRRFELRRDAVRNMLTVILAVLGLSALLVRSPGLSPWLVWSASSVVSLALVGSAMADERVLASQIRDARRLKVAIAAREHLPSAERKSLVDELDEISRRRSTPNLGWGVWGATLAAIVFVIVAATSVGQPSLVADDVPPVNATTWTGDPSAPTQDRPGLVLPVAESAIGANPGTAMVPFKGSARESGRLLPRPRRGSVAGAAPWPC